MKKFKIEFFKLYDQKICSGEITFSELGISKDDFTKLCSDPEFKFLEEKVKNICIRMKLTKEESDKVLAAYLSEN